MSEGTGDKLAGDTAGKSPWDNLDIAADMAYEQAAEATERLGRLAKLFYTALTTGEGALPILLAGPIVAAYVRAVFERSNQP